MKEVDLLDLIELVRSLQRNAGDQDCFRTNPDSCGKLDCQWRPLCLRQDPNYLSSYVSNMKSEKAPPTVLVVEDDDALRQLLQEYLQGSGFTCLSAASAPEAQAILSREKIDLVVSDIRMPGKNGVELMQETHRIFFDIPFILMTGYSSEYSYEDVINAGASDFIAKPFSPDELKAKIYLIPKE
jgi:CheY-like chemotaxis protein